MIKLDFKIFLLEKTEEEKNIEDTLKKIPKSHALLIKGFKFKFNKGNTLNNDDEHVGVIDPSKNTVTLAGPWSYGREFTFLHELAHKVWASLINENLRKKWKEIVKATKNTKNTKKEDALNQNEEELFCHAYSNYYTNHPLVIYDFKEWKDFIKKLPK